MLESNVALEYAECALGWADFGIWVFGLIYTYRVTHLEVVLAGVGHGVLERVAIGRAVAVGAPVLNAVVVHIVSELEEGVRRERRHVLPSLGVVLLCGATRFGRLSGGWKRFKANVSRVAAALSLPAVVGTTTHHVIRPRAHDQPCGLDLRLHGGPGDVTARVDDHAERGREQGDVIGGRSDRGAAEAGDSLDGEEGGSDDPNHSDVVFSFRRPCVITV